MCRLAEMHRNGGPGVAVDKAEAIRCYEQGAEQGVCYALSQLGELLFEGDVDSAWRRTCRAPCRSCSGRRLWRRRLARWTPPL